jgi:hypothetical protein
MDIDFPTRGGLYHCDACNTDITNLVRYKCVICHNFDLCEKCCEDKVKIFKHVPGHNMLLITPKLNNTPQQNTGKRTQQDRELALCNTMKRMKVV